MPINVLPHETIARIADLSRPGRVLPEPARLQKYVSAVDRDYYGSEYDGFQDIFTAGISKDDLPKIFTAIELRFVIHPVASNNTVTNSRATKIPTWVATSR